MVALGGREGPFYKRITNLRAAKRRAFCYEYLKDFNIIGALRRAGFAENECSGARPYEFFHSQGTQEMLQEIKEEMNERTKLDVEEVITRLRTLADKAEIDGRYGDAVKAVELLGKHLAMFTEKVSGDFRVNNPFASGDDQAAIDRDVERLSRVASPLLRDRNVSNNDPGE